MSTYLFFNSSVHFTKNFYFQSKETTRHAAQVTFTHSAKRKQHTLTGEFIIENNVYYAANWQTALACRAWYEAGWLWITAGGFMPLESMRVVTNEERTAAQPSAQP